MPLRPLNLTTGKIKALSEYTEPEKRSHIEEVLNEQLVNLQAQRPIDERALTQALQTAQELNDSPLADRIEGVMATIQRGPQLQTEPSRGLGKS